MKVPVIPFAGYKWRWAALTPTEGLNEPSVYLGVLRALRVHEGEPPSSVHVSAALAKVEHEAKSFVALARDTERNLIRNSGQYWKALDLLGSAKGEIKLTELGQKVADGRLSKMEFAATTVKSLELPNPRVESKTTIEKWEHAGVKIKPLQLLLEILTALLADKGKEDAYLTPWELVVIVIPLAGNNAAIADYVKAIGLTRSKKLNIAEWPDCAPEANDKRMAREFLLFLYHYGLCKLRPEHYHADERYYLADVWDQIELTDFLKINVGQKNAIEVAAEIKKTDFPYAAERRKVLTEVLARPQQAAFRSKVLKAYKARCILTGVTLESVLEAAHIIPVSEKGIDDIPNGFCMRSDIHLLFDSGHLRIDPAGKVHLSEKASLATNYSYLPKAIALPGFVASDFVEWRWNYS